MRDPAPLVAAASRLGEALVEKRCTWQDARLVCAALADLAESDYGATDSNAGRRARLCWAALDTALGIEHARSVADFEVRRAVRHLMESGAAKAVIEEAAARAAGEALDWPGIYAVLRDEAARVAPGKAPGRRYARRG